MKPHIRDFVEEFLGEVIEGSAAIFAGAGLSVPAGFVDWRELISPLTRELGLNVQLESDLVAVAQFHVNANGANRHKLHKAVIEAIAVNRKPTENHDLLAQLPIQTWWTTNYDRLIEDALRDRGKVVDVKSAVPQLAITRPRRDASVFKMHGDIERPDEAVATRDDFETYPRDRGAFITALAGDLVSKTFLFLGFSFTDPNLEHVLTRVRLTFASNQRRHFAVFRARSKQPNESDADFEHYRIRQALVIEDLKRFNVKVLTVDAYSEITDFLRLLVSMYKRRTIFIAASSSDFNGWSKEQVDAFTQKLGQLIVSKGSRIASGLGAGIGDSLLSGALREALESKRSIDETMILRPFPQLSNDADRSKIWDEYRKEIISHCGIAIFLFGTKEADGDTVIADGMMREFEIAGEKGVARVPVGGTGGAAERLAQTSLEFPGDFIPELGENGPEMLRGVSNRPDDPMQLIGPIMDIVQKLQSGAR